MKRITRNDDISFNVDEIRGKGERYNITFYTTNNAVNLVKNDINVTDGIIILNGSELIGLGEGVLNFRVDNIAQNSGYNDGVFNSSFTRTTDYYIQAGVIIPDGSDNQTVIEIVGQLQDALNAEITRSTNKDNAHDAALANVYTLLKAIYDGNEDTWSFTDADDTALSNAQVIQLLNDSDKEIKILYDDFIYQLNYQEDDSSSYYWNFCCADNVAIKTISLENYYEDGGTDIDVSIDSTTVPSFISQLGCGFATQWGSSASTITASIVGGTYKYVNGGIVAVMFTKANAAHATLNINNTGAKFIYYRNAAIKRDTIPANSIALFATHDGKYHLLCVDRWSPTEITSLNLEHLQLLNQGESIQLQSEYLDHEDATQISFSDSSSGFSSFLIPDDGQIMTDNMFGTYFDARINEYYTSLRPITTHGTHTDNTDYIQYSLNYGYYHLAIATTYASNNYDMKITLSDGSNTDKNRPVHTIIFDSSKTDGHGRIYFTNNLLWENGEPYFAHLGDDINYIVVTVYECKYATYKAW